ncbi:MAG: hypothetical protein K2X27_06950 [Candidatus Obscuribacterales bacterium]|nr:hypothetical protein [Candidatus Obscuribacterales bacterium]
MKIHLGMVSETTSSFLNQVTLCLFSLRRNGGALSDIPVTLITNNDPLSEDVASFFRKHFSPIEFRTFPRLGAIAQTSKLSVFYAIDPSEYDVLMYLDCDTVVRKSLDNILDPIRSGEAQFLCRRGGLTDRNRFVDFDSLVTRFCGTEAAGKIVYEGEKEWPMFNSGVFLASSEAVRAIRRDAIDFTYSIYDEWLRISGVEGLPVLRKLFRLNLLPSRQKVRESWTIEQGALALSCIKAAVPVQYLDEIYNSWGNLDFRILHCFKSAYKFDRAEMYSPNAETWLSDYSNSDLLGKVFLAEMVRALKVKLDLA